MQSRSITSLALYHSLVRVIFLYSLLFIFLSLNFLLSIEVFWMMAFQRYWGPKAMLVVHEKLCLAYEVVRSAYMLAFSQLLKWKNESLLSCIPLVLPKWMLIIVAFPCSTSFSGSPYLRWMLLSWRQSTELIFSIWTHSPEKSMLQARTSVRVHSLNKMSSQCSSQNQQKWPYTGRYLKVFP